LANQTVAWLGKDSHQGIVVELMEVSHNRDSADELRDHPVFDQIFRVDLGQKLGRAGLIAPEIDVKAHPLLVEPIGDQLVETDERTAADEEDVGGVDLQKLLVGMLAPPLGRHIGDRPLEDFQERLLDPLARNVSGYRRVFGFTGYLVNLVDINDAAFGRLTITSGRLIQAQEDVLNILSDVTGFGEGGRVDNGEWNLELTGEGLREKCFAGSGGPDEENIRFRQLDVVSIAVRLVLDAAVMVIHRYRKFSLGRLLADHILVEMALDFVRFGQDLLARLGLMHAVFRNDIEADLDALVADVHRRSGDQLAHLVLALATEAATQHVTVTLGHSDPPRTIV